MILHLARRCTVAEGLQDAKGGEARAGAGEAGTEAKRTLQQPELPLMPALPMTAPAYL